MLGPRQAGYLGRRPAQEDSRLVEGQAAAGRLLVVERAGEGGRAGGRDPKTERGQAQPEKGCYARPLPAVA